MLFVHPVLRMGSFVSALTVVRGFSAVQPLQSRVVPSSSLSSSSSYSTTSLSMVKTRGLEQRKEGATPTEGGMTLYVKASEDGVSVGDCPFAHFLRMVLEEKGLDYELRPTAPDAKPDWLNEYYEGKLPALRHRKECYVESGVIAEYVDFFFSDPPLKATSSQADEVLEGFFPAVAQYLKVDDDEENLTDLKSKLAEVNEHLSDGKDFLCGESFSLLDCRLIPQLYHLQTGIEGFKEGVPDIATDYPHIVAYYERMTARPSFKATTYPKEAILWGWGNARK